MAHVGQDQGEGPHLLNGVEDHLGGDPHLPGEADVQAGVGEDDESQLGRPVQDAQGADVVKVHPLVHRVELDTLHPQLLHPGELRAVVREVRMHAAEGVHPGLRAQIVDLGGAVVHMDHLAGVGGHRQHQGCVHPRPGHGGPQAGDGAVHIGPGVGHPLQLGDGGGGQLVREGVGVNINDHEAHSPFS